MRASIDMPVAQGGLIRLATKLREDLINYEDKFGSSREFAELMNSAGALVLAITEPEEFPLSGFVSGTGTLGISETDG